MLSLWLIVKVLREHVLCHDSTLGWLPLSGRQRDTAVVVGTSRSFDTATALLDQTNTHFRARIDVGCRKTA
jgi:hypothetical protein